MDWIGSIGSEKKNNHSEDGKFLAKRLSVLLSYATGVVAADSAVFVDFDTLPSTAASLSQTLEFLLADEARPLRAALVGEVLINSCLHLYVQYSMLRVFLLVPIVRSIRLVDSVCRYN